MFDCSTSKMNRLTSHGFVFVLVLSEFVYGSTADNALPINGVIKQGAITINSNGTTMNINQATQKGIIEWGTFNIGKSATVNFNQPNSASSTLNRVISSNPSEIYGNLNANGQVFLINPNGVFFSKTSKVDVGSLIVSTMNISDENYLNSNYIFQREGALGKIINEGELSAKEKGYIALMAPEVINDGVIQAKLGNIAIGSGEQIILSFTDNDLVNIEVSETNIAALIENKNLIITEEGKVFISAKSRDEVLGSMVKNSGIIEADSLISKNGEIYLESTNTIEISGILKTHDGKVFVGNKTTENTLIKSTAVLEGEFIETSAQNLTVEEGVTIQGKTWLLDPTDITIVSTGIDGLSGSNISGSTIDTTLNNGTSIILEATNNISINDNISKTSGADSTLTFKAGNNISLSSGKSITSTSNKLNLVLWANSDANGGGVTLNSGSSILTNGGDIWMGGGSGSTTWNGLSVGDSYAKGTLAAATSGIDMLGVSNSPISLNSNGGDIRVWGRGPNSGGFGIRAQYTTLDSGAGGSIWMEGDGYYSSGSNGHGIILDHSSLRGGSKGLNIIGKASINNTGQWSFPMFMNQSNVYTTDNGTLAIDLNAPQANGNNFYFFHDTSGGGDTSLIGSSQTGDITITATGTSTAKLYFPNIQTSGNFLVSSSSSGAQSIEQMYSTTKVVVGGESSFSTGVNSTISLTNTDNDFLGAISVNGGGNLSIADVNTLELGSINVSGKINISTQTGDVTLNNTMITSSTANDAIVINAGKNSSAGTSTGGNIIINGSLTVSTGAGGRATFYTGSILGSTALADLIGLGSGNFRYNSDESASNYTAALSGGMYGIYREQPILHIAPSNSSSIYGDSVSLTGGNYLISGYANGDYLNTIGLSGLASFSTTALTGNNAGAYNIAYTSGLSNVLGYAIVDASNLIGEYTINQRPITITADSASKTYGNSDPILSYAITSGNLMGSDSLSGVLSRTAGENVGSYTIDPSALANGNYIITTNNGTLTIDKAPLLIKADDKLKTYGQENPLLTYGMIGFVNGETLQTSGITGIAHVYTSATMTSPVGSMPIELALGTLDASNYQISMINGTLDIKSNGAVDNTLKVTETLLSAKKDDVKITNTISTIIENTTEIIFDTAVDEAINNLIAQLETETLIADNTQQSIEILSDKSKVVVQSSSGFIDNTTPINTPSDASVHAESKVNLANNPDELPLINLPYEKPSKNVENIGKNLSTDNFQNTILQFEQGFINGGMSAEESQMVTNMAIKLAITNPNGSTIALKELSNAVKVDNASVASALSNGNPPNGDRAFDQVFQALLSKGVSPRNALSQATTLARSIPKEIPLSEHIRSMSTDQVKIVLNLLAKGYTQNEALKIATSYTFPKESVLSNITSGEMLTNSPMLDKYLTKHSLEEALILSKKKEQEGLRYQTIDKSNGLISFSELSKAGKIPNNKLFDKILANKLKSHPFEDAYRIALDEYRSLFKNNTSPLEKMAQGTIGNSSSSADKIWWMEFIKNIMNGKNHEEATMSANTAKNVFEKKKSIAIKIDTKIYKRGKYE